MGKIGFLFAGQGAQKVGMGKELFDKYEVAQAVYQKAENYIKGLKELCFDGPIEELNKTINTQPCIYTTNIAISEILKEKDVIPDVIGGFSLGELSALVCSGALTLEKGLEIVKLRGELMQQASNEASSFLVAVMGLSDEDVEKLANSIEDVYPVNYNCPGQVVVAVGESSLEKFMTIIKEAKGKAMKLPVSGGFHSPYMDGASTNFGKVISKDDFTKNLIPVYSNFTGNLYGEDIDVNLINQINNPVRWSIIIRDMLLSGVDIFIEIGPGTTLSGFVKKTADYMLKNENFKLDEIKILNVQDEESLIKTITALRGE